MMYWQGKGLPQDFVRAEMWQLLAEHTGGTAHVEIFAGERGLTAAQRQSAELMAKQCLATHYRDCGGQSGRSQRL
jgi:hypothetical protein